MPLEIGISFLVNIGYAGPIAGDQPAIRGITCTDRHTWPPFAVSPDTKRKYVARHVLGAATRSGADGVELFGFLMGLAARPDDSIFVDNAPVIGPLQSAGICLEPAIYADDPVREMDGPIQPGGICAVILRGQPVPLVKVFAGLIEHHGVQTALFYLAKPEGVIEADIGDVLWVSRVAPPRAATGHDLLANADPFVTLLLERNGVAGDLQPTGRTRQEAWMESMLAILAVLRGQPA